MALGFKRSYRCRNLHTDEWTPLLAQMLWDCLFLLFKVHVNLRKPVQLGCFFFSRVCWQDIFLLSQQIQTCSLASIWRTHSCPLGIETKGAGHREIPSIWRHSHQLTTEPNMLFVMSSLILVQFLLLGLRVIDSTTDTRRHCTGIVPFHSDLLKLHLKKWEPPPAKILLDNSNCLCLLIGHWLFLCVQCCVQH